MSFMSFELRRSTPGGCSWSSLRPEATKFQSHRAKAYRVLKPLHKAKAWGGGVAACMWRMWTRTAGGFPQAAQALAESETHAGTRKPTCSCLLTEFEQSSAVRLRDAGSGCVCRWGDQPLTTSSTAQLHDTTRPLATFMLHTALPPIRAAWAALQTFFGAGMPRSLRTRRGSSVLIHFNRLYSI